MKLTKEQYEIIHSTGDIKINAVAGSGKTTTVIEYARAKPKTSRILYLAFNKSVKLQAQKKFSEKGLDNVKIETAHSLAYKKIVVGSNYKVRQGYTTNEIVELLHLKSNGEQHEEYVIANHINKFIAYFCNSDKQKVQDLNYQDVVSGSSAKAFVSKFYEAIKNQSRILLSKMNSGQVEITHDFYLKKFQLSNPELPFDYILFDEGQDASPAMLDVFLKQKATKVIVGDRHQQIYGWRHAVNSLDKADFKNFHLSTSFRFNQDISNLAMKILEWKKHIDDHTGVSIIGKGNEKGFKTKAILARTNLGLLLKAIDYVTENKKGKLIYFEGNINSYTYAEDGASLYDVLNLFNGKHQLIKDKLIRSMKDLESLEEYVEKTEEMQLGMMVEIVREYGNEIPGLIKRIKERHIKDDEKDKAEMIFSTVHRCKGMEYDQIELVNDFITEEKLEKLKSDKKQEFNPAKMSEEINLLYVAITRTKNIIYIPASLLPVGFPDSPTIYVVTESVEKEKEPAGSPKDKAWSVDLIREKHKGAYRPWTEELDDELTAMYCKGISVADISKHFGRTKGAIVSRIRRLELEDLYE